MRRTHMTSGSIIVVILTLNMVLPAFGDGFFMENLPPATLGNRKAGLFIQVNPPILTVESVRNASVFLRLYDTNTNKTIEHVSYFIKVEKGGKFLMQDLFHTHVGNLTLKIDPKRAPVQILGDETLVGWVESGGPIVVKGPLFLEGGLYHFSIELFTVDNDKNIFKPDDAPKFDSWLSIGDVTNNVIVYQQKSYDVSVISYYDKIKDFFFDQQKERFSYEMPFNWNLTRLQKNPIFVHEEIRVPRNFTALVSSTFTGTVNDMEIPSDAILVDDSDPYHYVVHYMLKKEQILKFADELQSGFDGQREDAMVFTLSSKQPIPEFPVNLMVITAAGLTGMLVVLRFKPSLSAIKKNWEGYVATPMAYGLYEWRSPTCQSLLQGRSPVVDVGLSKQIGITAKKNQDFSEWYTQVVLKAGLVDYAPVKGFIVLRPYGYAIWESIRNIADREFKKTGHQNAFLPVLIPESLLGRESEHFEGFKPEVFWVTHSGNDELSERLALRPTSETLAYEIYSKWVRSYRDLPLKLNFWNTALRAEIKATKPLIRTSEFLWQEGHTVHATEDEAKKEVLTILEIYRDLMEGYLAVPVITGYKSEKEKFVGAVYTTTLEALMADGKALQMGTSHNLGQNFSKPFQIKYLGDDDKEHYAWQTSWGISWRLIGALIMVHGDDKGLVLPPKVAPIQVVIVPILYADKDNTAVLAKAKQIADQLSNESISVHLDERAEYTPGYKFNDWEMKGVPLRIEIGPKDLEKGKVMLARRDTGEKLSVDDKDAVGKIKDVLQDIQDNLYSRAKELLDKNTHTVNEYVRLKEIINGNGGFVKASWCGEQECELKIKEESGADIRVMPFSEEKALQCVCCGKQGMHMAYFARAY